MKRTLLVTALAAMTLATNAQTSEVVRAKGDGFRFLAKNLTTDNKIVPYSTIGADYYTDEQDAEFTIYDDAFNKIKSFSYPLHHFKYKETPMKALVDITKKTVIDYWDRWPITAVEGKEFTSFEEFKTFFLNNNTNLTADDFFIDQDGNYAFHELGDNWIEGNGTETYNGKRVPTIRQRYYYYNKDEKKTYYCTAIMAVEFDTSNLPWEVDNSQQIREYSLSEHIESTELRDYDYGCNEDNFDYISQNIFNNDDKFEFMVQSYRKTSAPANTNTTFDNGLEFSKVEKGKLVIRKTVADNYYEEYGKVVNEDGKELLALPHAGKDLILYRVNGKVYLRNSEYNQETRETTYILYLIDNTATGLTELARTNPAKARNTFNMQGVQVNKNTKGLVIQQGGIKYLNK